MSQLFETLKLKDGRLYNLAFHNRRFNTARKEYFGVFEKLDLAQEIIIPDDKKDGLYRCRVIYSPGIEKIEFFVHQYREIKSLLLVVDNTVDYHFKYADRSHLLQLFEQRGDCDDILIVKNGNITDSYTANPIFFDGEKWWTPHSPLLPGTQRARLLEEGKISECRITLDDLPKYKKIGLVNAMWDMEDMPIVEIGKVF